MPSPYTKSSTIRRRIFRYSINDSALSVPVDTSLAIFNQAKSMTGNLLPKWRQIIRSGGMATTTFMASEDVLEHQPAMMHYYYQRRLNALNPWFLAHSYDYGWVNQLSIGVIGAHYTGAADQVAQDRAAALLYRKIYQARHQLQGGVILGEIDKTARLLAGTAKNLKQGVFNYLGKAVGIRRGRGSNSSKRKAISNSYLEATFGWQPLIHDCRDFAKTLGRLIHEVDVVRFRAFGEEEKQFSSAATAVNFGLLWANRSVTESTKCTVIYRGFLRGIPYEAGSPPIERMISMSGFDLRSFVPTMWELVPYSFVVDYFTNIGDCLLALSVDTSPVAGLWRTQVKESTRTVKISPDGNRTMAGMKANSDIKNITSESNGGLTTTKLRSVTRSATALPLLIPRLTGLDLPGKQFLNLGALITSKTAR